MYNLLLFVCFNLINLSFAALTGDAIVNCTTAGSVVVDAGQLVFVVDAWNHTANGFQCISVDPTGSEWEATWEWPIDRWAVHSFPHVRFQQPAYIPISLANVTTLTLSANWIVTADAADLDSDTTGMVSDISWDIFADPDPVKSQDDINAAYEIMIWLGHYGGAAPIGWSDNQCAGVTQVIGGNTYTLYCGPSWRPTRKTFSWVAEHNVTNSNDDFLPLFSSLVKNNYIPANTYIGDIGFGIEAFYAPDNVTFSASQCQVNIHPSSTPTFAPAPASTSAGSTSTQSGSSSSSHTGTSSSSRSYSIWLGAEALFFLVLSTPLVMAVLLP